METNQLTAMNEKRLEWMDVAKGIGIFLVVYAHAKAPFNQHIYLFHMPLFFLLSGYLYRSKGTFWQYFLKKFKSLYIPFVGWNFVIIGTRLVSWLLRGQLTWSRVSNQLKLCGRVLLAIDKEGDYLGAIWFLGSLFLVSLVYKCLDLCVKDGTYKYPFITALFAAAGITSFYIQLPFLQNRTLILGMFYAFGYLIRLKWEDLKPCFGLPAAAAALVLLAWIGSVARANMGSNEYTNIGLFLIAACLGSYITICVSMAICKAPFSVAEMLKRMLVWWGKNSIDIVIWQFVMFRLVAAFQFWLEGESITNAIATRIYITDGLWWIAYTAVGILVPLAWGWLLRQGIWGRVLKKLYLVR